MLFIEPKEPPSREPLIDELTMKMVAALRKATLPDYRFLGFHTCLCGAKSDSTNFVLPNGVVTNSLCVHYLAYHRAEVEARELLAVDGLSNGSEYPDSYELHGPTTTLYERNRAAARGRPVREIDQRRELYEARQRSLWSRLAAMLRRRRVRLVRPK
jgi:hypothetical protein